ncbi:hypothetical protein ACEE74_08085 [Streptococcus orisratti]
MTHEVKDQLKTLQLIKRLETMLSSGTVPESHVPFIKNKLNRLTIEGGESQRCIS